jgi:hypothetical protein
MIKISAGRIAAYVIVVLIFPAVHVHAAPVRVAFEGTVTDALLGAGDFFRVGDPMTGDFVYDSSAPTDYQENVYRPFAYPNRGFTTIGAYTVRFKNDGYLFINNDVILNLPDPTLVDQFTADPAADGPDLGGLRPRNLAFNLIDATASVFDSRDLPTSLPPLSSFAVASWTFVFTSTDPNALSITTGFVDGVVTALKVTIVPEPSTWLLVSMGGVSIIAIIFRGKIRLQRASAVLGAYLTRAS